MACRMVALLPLSVQPSVAMLCLRMCIEIVVAATLQLLTGDQGCSRSLSAMKDWSDDVTHCCIQLVEQGVPARSGPAPSAYDLFATCRPRCAGPLPNSFARHDCVDHGALWLK